MKPYRINFHTRDIKFSYLTFVILVSALWCQPVQSQSSKPVVHKNPVTFERPKDGKEKVKDFLSRLSAQLADLTNKSIDSKVIFLRNKVKECPNTDDVTACEAGILFTGGYHFQVIADGDLTLDTVYLRIAEQYYRSALLKAPDHQSALKNLILLNIAQGDIDTAITMLKTMAAEYPEDRSKNLIRIGDLYLEQKDPKQACAVFRQAYDEDPFSSEACSRITSMYERHHMQCFTLENFTDSKHSAINLLAIGCNEVGLPNYAEQLLRQQILYSIVEDRIDKIEENILLWTNILVVNRWFDTRRIENLINGMKKKYEKSSPTLDKANQLLADLARISKATVPAELSPSSFWRGTYPFLDMGGNEKLSPEIMFLKILQYKGGQSLEGGLIGNAELWWQEAFNIAEYESTRITSVAQELAQLYAAHPEIDPEGKKMEEMTDRLFNGKMMAYFSNNKEMIRKFHTVLGGIFYSQKKWEGGGKYANARYQLSHALDEDLGPIVNPELRMMLGETYLHIAKSEPKAVSAFEYGIRDMLLVDRVDEAADLVKRTRNLANDLKDSLGLNRLDLLSRLIELRKECANPKTISGKDSLIVTRFLQKWKKESTRLKKYFPSDFVSNQYFKCMSDLGSLMQGSDLKLQQIAYVEALNEVVAVNMLYSANDFKRIQNIKKSLDQSVDRPYLMKNAQLNVKTKGAYGSYGQQADDKVIQVSTLGKEIRIPNTMLKLGNTVKEYYKSDQMKEVPKYQYDKSVLILKANQIQKLSKE